MSPIEILRDPNLVQSMSINQKLISGLQVAILGMLIVFFILFLLMVVLKILEKLFYKKKSDLKEDKTQLERKDKKPAKKRQNEDIKEVAAIMAAIMCLNTNGKKRKFRIKRITRVKDDVPIWGHSARGGKRQQNNKGELL